MAERLVRLVLRRRRVVSDGNNAGTDRVVDKIDTVTRQALAGEEQVALLQTTAVATNATDRDRRRIDIAVQQLSERHVHG